MGPKMIISVVLATIFAMWVNDYLSKYGAIDNKIKHGSNPPLLVDHFAVNRSDIVEKIVSSFILPPENEDQGDIVYEPFGMIVGPTGTGKTQLIRQACHQNPKGALYLEIGFPKLFVEDLAKAVDMRITPTFTSVLLGGWFPNYLGYYKLPENDDLKAIGIVINSLVERALVFKQKEGRPVCLFIDGADLLAKYEKETFRMLVDAAKKHANSKSLRIVFGCGEEGSVLTEIRRTSSKSRIKAVEVGDLSDDNAIDYLKKLRMPEELATRFVKFAGGRLIFLHRAVSKYREVKMMKQDDIYHEIIEDLDVYFVLYGIKALIMNGDRAINLIKHLQSFDPEVGFNCNEYLEKFSEEEQNKVQEVIELLVGASVFRYTAKFNVTWHSRLMQNMATEFFKESKKL